MGAENFGPSAYMPFNPTMFAFDLGEKMNDRELPSVGELEDRLIELEAQSDEEMELRADEIRNSSEVAIAEIAIGLFNCENFSFLDHDTLRAAEKYLQFFFKKNTD